MINVLHLRDTNKICGPGKTIIETACAADPSKYRLSVGVYSSPGRPNGYIEAARTRGIEVHPIEASHALDPRVIGQIASLVRDRGVHVLHSHDYLSDILTRIVKLRVDVAIMSTVHGWITNSLRSRALVRMSQRALRGFDRVVAVSEMTRARVIAAGVPADRVVVIHNAIVAQNYRPDRVQPGLIRTKLALPPDAILVGSIGRLSPEKGQRDFLAAAARLSHRDPRAHFVLVGSGPDDDALQALARALGLENRVHFLGHLSDVRPVYRDLDVLALTSYTEGFPNVILEALCMDVPVLATDVGGVPEIVTDGQTGVLVDAHDVDAIEAGLWRLLNDRLWASRLAARGKAAVLDQFEFGGRTAKEERIYQELAAEHAHA